ncbi:hypothetical protein CSV67_08110 [Sporosarcina sp. P2]|uniref:ApeA N-terminal domain 1-containing protein n=1 Tax=Sporosarcina sp. P2 TaxID=2048251 RepID=UPI000C164E97|nr:HEPN domain-containing protein [Sporosarcina sp. P2]PID02590.1 hypothetical protein CSV67_08110 [Sporosarcina sp. P2]
MVKTKAMKKNMFDSFEIKGYWWTATNKEKVSGILFFTPNNIRLELIGSFGKIDFLENILGFSDVGEQFTLMDCYLTNFEISSPGFNTVTYSIQSFLVGGIFDNLKEIKFHSMAMYPTYFSTWKSNYLYKTNFDSEGTSGHLSSIEFNKKHLFTTYVDCIETSIEETYSEDLAGNFHEDLHWVHKGGFKLIPDESKNLEWYKGNMNSTCNLYTLFIGLPIQINNLFFYSVEERQIEDATYRDKISYFFIQDRSSKLKKFHYMDSTIKYQDIEADFNNIFNAWFEKQENLKTIIDLHMSDFYIDAYLETRFLNAIQILEIYHRKKFDGKLMDESQFHSYKEKLLKEAEGNFSEVFYKKLEGMLAHGNEYSLNKRLRELLGSLETDTQKVLIGNSKKRGKFVQQLVDTRNYLTHYDLGTKTNILESDDQKYCSIYLLKALATLIIFKEINIGEKLIVESILKSKQFSYTISEAKELLF